MQEAFRGSSGLLRVSAGIHGRAGGVRRAVASLTLAAGLIAPAWGAPVAATGADPVTAWTEQVWEASADGGEDDLLALLAQVPESANERLRLHAEGLRKNLEARESARAEQIAEHRKELAEHLEAAEAEGKGFLERGVSLSKALLAAVEIELVTPDKAAFLAEDRIVELRQKAEAVAREAERRGEWLLASEIFFRLEGLFEGQKLFEEDVRRLAERLTMVQMYAPERFWELRNARRLAEGEDPLPPYNPYGDGYREKLAGIDANMVNAAVRRAASEQVEHVSMRDMLVGGLTSVETFATTTDLARTFSGLGDAAQRARFLGTVRELRDALASKDREPDAFDLRSTLQRLMSANTLTIGVPQEALLHEFGNGAMRALDDYSGIIWPHDIARFQRSMQGAFTGIGVHIQMDEQMNVKVVTPLDGSPALRAGMRANDIITKVNGRSIVGFTVDQAVDVITGPAGSPVTLTVERTNENGEKRELDVRVVRDKIDLPSVAGWRKTGPGEWEWDWFVDDEARIGYLRLTGFTQTSTADFDRAIAEMRARGLEGLVLDLRFNPGGLLDQAVSLASRFVDRGLIVKTEDSAGIVRSRFDAERVPSGRRVNDLPVVVLINEGSASASEILSGAIQAHAEEGGINARIVGQNSFGKGSVQDVHPLNAMAAMKLTTQYYKLRTGAQIHKLPGASSWGIRPDLEVEMLPKQTTDALVMRREADLMPLDEQGRVIQNPDRPDPSQLLEEGLDLQLQAGLVLLLAQNGDGTKPVAQKH